MIVKLYEHEEGELSLNDAVEFIGILSMDPNLARVGFEDAEGTAMEHDFVAQVDLGSFYMYSKRLKSERPKSE